ncbi:MAG TPA: DUF1735 domain-containing protein [Mucilaginibacter sp.]|jgi:hypothetical protein|nr:DUF1735 domain-containing protein [Mucilaginibacter sp.]
MKKLIMILTVVTISLAGCLKDNPNVDFSKIVPTINLPYSGLAYFSKDAVTDAGDTITKSFTINLASDYPLKTDTKVTVGVDNSVIATYNASQSAIVYNAMPAGSFTFPQTTVTIKAGTRLATLSVTFIKHLLDPSQSYLLPIRILSADQVISSNFSIHYYHFIGNDFAGTYLHDFTRVPAAGNYVGHTITLSPVNPTQFEMAGGYFTGNIRYEVTFTKTGSGASATYTNFAVSINADDIANILTPAGIAIASGPTFVSYDPTHAYTYNEVVHGLLLLNWHTVSGRSNTDYYYKP